MFTALLLSVGLAANDVVIGDDGFVRATRILDAPAWLVRAVLADGATMATTSPEVLTATATPDGACEHLDLTVRGLLTPFHVATVRCATGAGWTERLEDSGVFTAWDARWTIEELGDGRTRVDAAIRTEVDLPVPASLVRSRTASSVQTSLDRVAARVAAAR